MTSKGYRIIRDGALEVGDTEGAWWAELGAELCERPPEEWEWWRIHVNDWCGLLHVGGSERRRCACRMPQECLLDRPLDFWPSTGEPVWAVNADLAASLGTKA